MHIHTIIIININNIIIIQLVLIDYHYIKC
jgi:hypothetical protein